MTDPNKPDPLDEIRNSIDTAVFVTARDDGDDHDSSDTPSRPGPGPFASAVLPQDCPIEPLGQLGEVYFYLDQMRQLRALKARDHTRLNILSLMGTKAEEVYSLWPRKKEDGTVNGWQTAAAEQQLMAACSRRGVWDPAEKLRGPGAWLGDDGGLVFHCGDAVLVNRLYLDPGHIGHHVYPSAAPQPRPGEMSPGEAADLVNDFAALLASWNWKDGENDAHLMLGWTGAAIIGGALDWRAMAFVTGGPSSGKSTLQRALQRVFDDAIISVSDTTAAGVWQKIGHASLPVAIDEMEAEEDNRRANMLIKLARQASSGGLVLRGGSDHTGAEFKARSCFLFSSINMPPLLEQDRSRLAVLELEPFEEAQSPPDLEPDRLRKIGQAMRKRMLDGWPRWNDTLEIYRVAFDTGGLGARAADQFGTLLAAADLLLNDAVPEADARDLVTEWIDKIKSGAGGGLSSSTDYDRCLNHLLTTNVELFRGGSLHSIGRWLLIAAGREDRIGDSYYSPEDGNEALSRVGMRVFTNLDDDMPGQWLGIANEHEGLNKVFRGTHWAARSGASAVWVGTLRRVKGHFVPKQSQRFGGIKQRYTAVPLARVLRDEDDDSGQE